MDEKLKKIFYQSNYSVTEGPSFTTFKSHISNSLAATILSVVLGILFFGIGLIADLKIFFFGIILFTAPFIYTGWKFPAKLIYDGTKKVIVIYSRIGIVHEVDYADVVDIYVEAEELSSHVSAFEHGNKDFVYEFFLKEKTEEIHRLLRLQSRSPIAEEQIYEIAQDLNDLVNRR